MYPEVRRPFIIMTVTVNVFINISITTIIILRDDTACRYDIPVWRAARLIWTVFSKETSLGNESHEEGRFEVG